MVIFFVSNYIVFDIGDQSKEREMWSSMENEYSTLLLSLSINIFFLNWSHSLNNVKADYLC